MSGLLARRAKKAAAGGAFNPQTSITWRHLFWAEGTEMAALAYADAASVTAWPNEIDAGELSEATNPPAFRTSYTNLNSKPAVDFDGTDDRLQDSQLSSAITYGATHVIIMHHDSVGSTMHLTDGVSGSRRNLISARNGGPRGMFAGTTRNGSAATTGGHLFLAHFSNSTSDYLNIDGIDEVSGLSAGSQQYTVTTAGNGYWLGVGNGGALAFFDGAVALWGIYEGDLKSDGQYANFKTWVTDHYGITLS